MNDLDDELNQIVVAAYPALCATMLGNLNHGLKIYCVVPAFDDDVHAPWLQSLGHC